MKLDVSSLYHIAISPVPQIIATVIGALLVQIFSQNFIERIVRRTVVVADRAESKLDEKKREDTIISIFRATTVALIWLVVLLVILTILNVNLAALITGAGLFGVIFGLGAQNTIKDYLAGIYILRENQYRVGDIVTLSGGTTSQIGASGVVEAITLRITKLRDMDGSLNIVRNGEAGIITNRTFKHAGVIIDMVLDYGSDLTKVEQIMNEVGIEMLDEAVLNKQVIEPVRFLRIDGFNDAGILVKGLGKVKPGSQWDIASAYRSRIKVAFDKHAIRFGVPHRRVETKH